MTVEAGFAEALSASALGGEAEEQQLLQSVVTTARAIFAAAASSIMLLDESDQYLVFEAVAGEGGASLKGQRFPAADGIAGWVLASAETVAIDDLAETRSFAREVAEATGYVPQRMLVAPLNHDGLVVGVIEILDPATDSRRMLGDLDLLRLFADQAVVALQIVRRNRQARDAFGNSERYLQAIRVLRGLWQAPAHYRDAAGRLLDAIEDILSASQNGAAP